MALRSPTLRTRPSFLNFDIGRCNSLEGSPSSEANSAIDSPGLVRTNSQSLVRTSVISALDRRRPIERGSGCRRAGRRAFAGSLCAKERSSAA